LPFRLEEVSAVGQRESSSKRNPADSADQDLPGSDRSAADTPQKPLGKVEIEALALWKLPSMEPGYSTNLAGLTEWLKKSQIRCIGLLANPPLAIQTIVDEHDHR
jgi:hypothetical protein